MDKDSIPEPFYSVVQKIKSLERLDEYTGAFLFGSVARGEQTSDSDVDIKVVTSRKEACDKVNHPYINNIKLDISFNTKKQILQTTKEELESRKRIAFIAESIIIFDKEGFLQKLKAKATKTKPKILKKKDYQWSKFMIYHAHDKTFRNLETDKATAMLTMGININDILKDHYKLNGQWWVSNKRILSDLDKWDPELAQILRAFALESDVNKKYKYYLTILDYVSTPMGDWRNLEDENCNCKFCKKDLAYLT